MTAQQEAYINGFVKRANQHGLSDSQAIELLKESGALGDLVTSAGNAYNNYVNKKNTPTPADLAANAKIRQAWRPKSGTTSQALPSPVSTGTAAASPVR